MNIFPLTPRLLFVLCVEKARGRRFHAEDTEAFAESGESDAKIAGDFLFKWGLLVIKYLIASQPLVRSKASNRQGEQYQPKVRTFLYFLYV